MHSKCHQRPLPGQSHWGPEQVQAETASPVRGAEANPHLHSQVQTSCKANRREEEKGDRRAGKGELEARNWVAGGK